MGIELPSVEVYRKEP